jgi:hypothetical protein
MQILCCILAALKKPRLVCSLVHRQCGADTAVALLQGCSVQGACAMGGSCRHRCQRSLDEVCGLTRAFRCSCRFRCCVHSVFRLWCVA